MYDKTCRAIIYLVGRFAPGFQGWPETRCHLCWKLYTCQHGGALGWRRRPPRGAPSPYADPRAGSCLGDARSDGDRWPRPTFGPFLAFVATHPAAASCLCSHRHMRPGVGNMPPPVWGKRKSKDLIVQINMQALGEIKRTWSCVLRTQTPLKLHRVWRRGSDPVILYAPAVHITL